MLRRNIIKICRSAPFNSDTVLYKNIFYIRNAGCKCITTKFQYATQNITKKLTDEEYLVKIKNDPDTFGSEAAENIEYDEGDLKEDEYLENIPNPAQKLRIKQYADIIKALIRKKKIKEAIDILEVRMLKDDRVKPEAYIYNLLLGACGRVGYTKKAFSLYNRMKQRDLKVTAGAYTALFNACANSPFLEDGLSRARHLREIMIEKGYEPNDTNYNVMIKAFGRCGDLATAFSFVDEMQQKNMPIKDDTLNFLLQACITDKVAGYRHSLLVWRKFIERNVAPNIYSYNLLLRCVRECGLGDIETTKNVIDNIIENYKLPNNFSHQKMINSGEKCIEPNKNENIDEQIVNKNVEIVALRPNLIARIPHLGNILSISEITKPEDRLLLVGGCSGFLKTMLDNQCTPNTKTFTMLLDCIPSTLVAEKDLIIAMKKYNVKPDIDFYNMLIKKRSMRFDYEYAKEVLKLIKTAGFRPDLITYGVLALGCQTKEEAESLIQEMERKNYRMNPEILGAMLNRACYHVNFPYVLEIMEICIREQIRPNKKFMNCLEEFRKRCKKLSKDENNGLSKNKVQQKGYEIFKMRYRTWKEEADPLDEENTHPWQQFKQETRTYVKHYKDKDMSSRFKPRHSSLYRQKKNKIIDRKKDSVRDKNDSRKTDVVDFKTANEINQTW